MAALNNVLILAFIIGAGSANNLLPPSPCPLDNARYLPVYDLENATYNVLNSDDFLSSFRKDGFYQFKDVHNKMFGGMFYGDYPVLVVYQPDETVPELHGYHYSFPWGLQMIYDTNRFDAKVYQEYKHFRNYLDTPIDKEGYTPSAALQIYPEFENMNLTKIVRDPKAEKFTRGFALLFLLPKKEHLKPKHFDKKYSLFEEFYYNGTKICKVTAEKNEDVHYEDDDDEYVPLLTIYSRYTKEFETEGTNKGHNIVDLYQVNAYYAKNGFYKFNNFVEDVSPYDKYPILIVFQPDEATPELHGFYFDHGILSLASYVNDNPDFLEEYRPFFEYLENEPDLDGLTPDAARFDYPYFFDYNLTKFTHGENVAEQFAILFLAPARYRPTAFLEKYNVIEDYGVGDKHLVEYQVEQPTL